MNQHEVSRTLVKSQPELWAELSDAGQLARHLGQFGEIRITRIEPEIAVAWEGDRVSGTVKLEPSGWGTRVTLTAVGGDAAPAEDEPAIAVEQERDVAAEVEEPAVAEEEAPVGGEAQPRPRLFGRLLRFMRSPASEPPRAHEMPNDPPPARVPEPPVAPDPPPAAAEAGDPLVPALTAALDSLGQAHHRPFSRA